MEGWRKLTSGPESTCYTLSCTPEEHAVPLAPVHPHSGTISSWPPTLPAEFDLDVWASSEPGGFGQVAKYARATPGDYNLAFTKLVKPPSISVRGA
jgi:hypothetical protein